MSDDPPTDDGTTEGTDDPEDGEPDDAGPDRADQPLGDLAEDVARERSDVDPEATGEDHPREREGPLSDVAEELEAADPGEGPADQLFEEVDDVGEIDREALWRQVAGEEAAARVEEADEGPGSPGGPTVQRPEGAAAGTVDVEDRRVRVVEKAKYCQGCEYFSPPPDVHCTHEGTEIVEMVDVEHFRVANCPVVAEDEELENV